jgi:hypothetical protein
MRKSLVPAVLLLAVTAGTATAGSRNAGPILPDGRAFEHSTFSRDPLHGYSGSPAIATRKSGLLGHCDYHRLPVRQCGAGGCKVVAWELKQYCY